jgi:hypothetical protein
VGAVGLSREEITARVVASCAASGVPVHVEDAAAIAGIAALLRAPAEPSSASARRAERAAGRPCSQPPGHLDPVRIQRSRAPHSGTKGDAADEGPQNRRLPVEVQLRPPAA